MKKKLITLNEELLKKVVTSAKKNGRSANKEITYQLKKAYAILRTD